MHGDELYMQNLARRFARVNRDQYNVTIENFAEAGTPEFFSDIARHANLAVFAYIGHGMPNALASASVNTRAEITRLANTLGRICKRNAVIIFYACSAGRLGNSITQSLHDLTHARGFTFYGHSTSGRAGNNPNKTVFPPAKGAMLVDRVLGDLANAPRFRRAWNASFGNESKPLWARFWRMSEQQLLETACESQLARARRANTRLMARLGWSARLSEIIRLIMPARASKLQWQARVMRSLFPPFLPSRAIYNALLLSEARQNQFAIAVARYQMARTIRESTVDGILGQTTWAMMQAELAGGALLLPA